MLEIADLLAAALAGRDDERAIGQVRRQVQQLRRFPLPIKTLRPEERGRSRTLRRKDVGYLTVTARVALPPPPLLTVMFTGLVGTERVA
jgi:hypothetical protein